MLFERLKAISSTLRFRLMLWNAFAVLLTATAILFCMRAGLRYYLLRELDQTLSEDLNELFFNVDASRPMDWDKLHQEIENKARGHEYHQWFAIFASAQGEVIWQSTSAPALPTAEIALQDVRLATSGDFRYASRKTPAANLGFRVVIVGSSQEFIARDMASIDELVGVVGGGVLLIAPLGGYLLALRTTRPLANIIHTTARFRPSQMEERLPIRGTGDELDSLARTVNGLLDRIADYLRQKHDFVANAAHELRTPLAAIRSSVEVALGGNRTVDEYQELLSQVIDQCSSLESLVNQLLLLAETDADRLKTYEERVSLDKIVAQSVEMFRGVAEDRGLRLTANSAHFPPIAVAGNRHHLRQVLNNLLDNAIKFTAAQAPPGQVRRTGEIVVTLSRDDQRNQATLQISDNGIGMDEESCRHIFERFYRVDKSRSRDGVGGTGLGLSIVQAIIEAHQGKIKVDSQIGEGTTFTITLPLAPDIAFAYSAD